MPQNTPLRPDFNRSPSLLTGMGSRPETRGKTADELNATLPVFSSWEEAAVSPAFAGMDDRTRTMWLQELYGLGRDRAVENGRIVNTNHSLRNGLLGGIAMMGGLSAIGAAGGAGGGAAAYVPGAANIINPASTAAGVGFGAAPAAGAGAGMGAASWIGRGIDAGANIYGANRANAASNRAAAAAERGAEAELAFLREQEAERRRQWEADQAFQAQKFAADEEERAFNRRIAEAAEADRGVDRRLREERETRLAPYRAASADALGRIGTILGAGQTKWRSPSNAGRGTLGAMVGR